MAKFYRDAKMYPQALRWAKDVFRCNPLRGDCQPYVVLGSIHLEAGDTAAALESLQKAYDLAGKRAFQGEDPKYLKFVQAHTKK